MPVAFGPNHQRFREALGLIASGAGLPVKDYPTFAAAMDKALAEHVELGQKAKEYIASEIGATGKIFGKIFPI